MYALAPDRQGDGVWLAVTAPNPLPQHGARILKFQEGKLGQELQPYPWLQDSQRTRVTTMLQDRRGRLWVGTWVNGVFCWEDGQGWRQPDPDRPTSWHPVDALAEDEDGLIWMVTRDGGLHRIAERKVTALSPPEDGGQHHDQLRVRDPRRQHLGGHGRRRCVPLPGWGFRAVHQWPDLRPRRRAVRRQPHQPLGWNSPGTAPLGRKPLSPVLGTDSPGFRIYALHEDARGNLWGGSNDRGLFRRAPTGEIRYYGREAGLDHYFIRAITEDAEGRICLAVWERGLYRLAGEKFEKFTADRWPGLPAYTASTPTRRVDSGLPPRARGSSTSKTGDSANGLPPMGLPDMLLRAVVADEAGNLWFSSNKGIFGCAPEALQQYQRGKSPPVLFWRLSARDGLPGKLASGTGQPVAARSDDGRLWFPNYRALAGFDPAVVRQTGRSLSPIIEELRADGTSCPADAGGNLRLRSGVRRLEFHYTCAELRAPERLRFQYRLDGYDPDWVDAGAQRVAYYGRLLPGTYRFRVKAGGISGEWRETVAAPPLTIVPHWWERASVRVAGVLLLVLLSSGTVWLVLWARHRRRLARLQLQQIREAERRRIARDIHDDLGATLTRMLWLGEMSATPEAAQAQMPKVATAAREMSRSLEAIVWAVRPENDTLRSLVTYLGRRMDELFEGTGTAYRFVAPHDLPDRMMFAEARHNVFLACKEALTNALKHSRAAEVQIELSCNEDHCQITITDNGRGFEPQGTLRTGASGLKNMRARMEEIKGGFELHSEPGKGTTVRLSFPIPMPKTA